MSEIEINRGAKSVIGQSGIGYIVVPEDKDRQRYIDDCYRTGLVSINGGYGYGYIHSVRILSDAMQKISFPITQKDKGSAVLWIRENFSNRPIIIAALESGEYTNLLKGSQQRISQQLGDNNVEIFLDAETSTLNFNVFNSSENKSTINLKASSSSSDSVINLESDGEVNLSANKITAIARNEINVSLKTMDNEEIMSIVSNGEKTEFKDKFKNSITADANNINLRPSKLFNINNGDEPVVLGDTLVSLLKEILQAISQITVMTPAGGSSIPVNAAAINGIKSKLDAIKSKITKTE